MALQYPSENPISDGSTQVTTSLIDNLPPELLLRVFRLAASSIFSRQCQKNWSVQIEEWYWWMSLLFVCRRWRDIVVQDSYLWSRLYLPIPDDTLQLALERSKERPLMAIIDEQSIILEGFEARFGDIVNTSRLEELHCRLDCNNGGIFEWPIFKKAYPQLTKLNLSMTLPHELWIEPEFPPKLSTFPRLVEFRAHRVALHWNRLTNLSLLQTMSVDYDDLHQAKVTEVLEVLRGMPLLRDLNLALEVTAKKPKNEALRRSRHPFNIPIVNLPHLEKFRHLCTSSYGSRILLDYLRFPGSTRIEFRFEEKASSACVALGSKLKGETTLSAPSPIEKLYIFTERYGPYFLRGRSAAASGPGLSSPNPRMPYNYEIGFHIRLRESGDIFEMMMSVLTGLPLTSVRCLSISSGSGSPTTDHIFSDTLALGLSTPGVEILRLTGSRKLASSLEEFLGTPVIAWNVSRTHLTPATCAFPQMTTLEIRNFEFAQCTHPDGKHYGCLDAFIELLQFRTAHGCAPLEHLRISRCVNITEEQNCIQRLSAVIPRITWDGYQNQRSEEIQHEIFGPDTPYHWKAIWAKFIPIMDHLKSII
ncbi:hypothetical protein BDY19DRAFT_990973 [Irpex rosettiformis]|uniref:Uncharacterized protein n=1 Tax=Irpex rosettiformis TaxID=378272 RepID=A0ACB8UD42_9APHY|nr:hypothetical protein BDY19DRAFT_990973 [Irpex rosettiformis]